MSLHYGAWKRPRGWIPEGKFGITFGPMVKRQYRQIKTGEEISEKLLGDVCTPLRELYLFSHNAVFEPCSYKNEKVIFCSALKTMAKSEMFSNKTQKEAFQETAL